jgi:glycogen phosphorylase
VVLEVAARDGWWIEGCNEGVAGWAISDHDLDRDEANSLYEHLERMILPLSYRRPDEWRRALSDNSAVDSAGHCCSYPSASLLLE